jgi:hypothetical protein
MRKNIFAHKEFNTFIGSKEGKKYYEGIYQAMNPKGEQNKKSKNPSISFEDESYHDAFNIMVPKHLK